MSFNIQDLNPQPTTIEYFFLALFYLCVLSTCLSMFFFSDVDKHETNVDVIRFCRCSRFINIVALTVFVPIVGLIFIVSLIYYLFKEPLGVDTLFNMVFPTCILCFYLGPSALGIYLWTMVLKKIGEPQENRWFV